MWLRVSNGCVNSRDVLLAKLLNGRAVLLPLVAGHWGGAGDAKSALETEYPRVFELVDNWCEIFPGEYLNIERFAFVDLESVDGKPQAVLYLADLASSPDFVFEDAAAKKIANFLEARRKTT